ncbi:hypothetical protein AB0B31_11340 [Catellatospora citrea]|uniref:hypothetical protein n=1 Tax=Catellatospora citrea TaxID=53366 RepID=UPI00340BF649
MTNLQNRTPTGTVRVAGKARRRVLLAILATLFAVTGGILTDPTPAAANTPSDYSHTFYVGATRTTRGLPVTVGWTKDHAWVIASWAATMSAGAGLIASQVCSIASGETGPLNPVGRACSTAVSTVVAELLAGRPRLTDHGLWIAYYVSPFRRTSGTW